MTPFEKLVSPKPPPEHVCPECEVERADYEGPNRHLPRCPNCNTEMAPVNIGHPARRSRYRESCNDAIRALQHFIEADDSGSMGDALKRMIDSAVAARFIRRGVESDE